MILPGEAVTVGQQCPQIPLGGSGRVLTFYELTTPVESLRVRKVGGDVEVSW